MNGHTWLVTGGAGYVGSHVVDALVRSGFDVVVLDDMSTGDSSLTWQAPTVIGSVMNSLLVTDVLSRFSVAGIVHLAGKKRVHESIQNPLHYYDENVSGLRVVLQCAVQANVRKFIFSSSAAVYGAIEAGSVPEDASCTPASPYGRSKLAGEWMVQDVSKATGMRSVILRYFNVAGSVSELFADRSLDGLIASTLLQIGRLNPPVVFGSDYPTADGSCVRDFVHAADVAEAHLLSVQALESGKIRNLVANVGTGRGSSVMDVVNRLCRLANADGYHLPSVEVRNRRDGDLAEVVASVDCIRDALGWSAKRDIDDMTRSAWNAWRFAQRSRLDRNSEPTTGLLSAGGER